MKYLTFIRHSERYRESGPPPALMEAMATFVEKTMGGWAIVKTDSKAEAIRIATEFMELHRKHWPGFEGESEVRPMFESNSTSHKVYYVNSNTGQEHCHQRVAREPIGNRAVTRA